MTAQTDSARAQVIRVKGHKLTLYSAEGITTGHCKCGWHSDQTRTQQEARNSYRRHLDAEARKRAVAQAAVVRDFR